MTVIGSRTPAIAGRGQRRPRACARRRARSAARDCGEWRRRARDRAELAALDDRMLADIGISRAEAEFLSGKPFWRE